MGSIRKKTFTKPLPSNAILIDRKGVRFARWTDAADKVRTAKVTTGRDGGLRISTQASTYTAKFRAADGTIREVQTGCRDKLAALAVLAAYEQEVEKIKAGIISQAEVSIADRSLLPISDHLAGYLTHQRINASRESRLGTYRTRNTSSRRFVQNAASRRCAMCNAARLKSGWS